MKFHSEMEEEEIIKREREMTKVKVKMRHS